MDVNFMEPCCISKQLPPLMREHELVPFQTNGDVTFEQIIKAVSSLAGNLLDIVVVVPEIDVTILRVLAWYGRRGWVKGLKVLTKENQAELIHNEVSDTISGVQCFHHGSVVESMLIIQGEISMVVVQGVMLSEVNAGHRFYYAFKGKVTSFFAESIVKTIYPLLRKEDVVEQKVTETEQPAEIAGETTIETEENTTKEDTEEAKTSKKAKRNNAK